MKKKLLLLSAVFVLMPFLIFAQGTENSGKVTVESLRKKYDSKKSVDLSFELTIFWSVRERYEKKNGELTFSPGEKFKLTLGNSTWVSNGQTYWQFSNKTNQVVIKSLLDIDLSLHPSSMMQSFLSYPFSVFSSDEKTTILQWMGDPKNSDLPYKKITVNVDKKKMIINELTVTDDDGNESRYIFKRSKFGENKAPRFFDFSIPEGADVLDTRK